MTTDETHPEVTRALARLKSVAEHGRRQADRVAALGVLGRYLGLWSATAEEDAADAAFVRRVLSE